MHSFTYVPTVFLLAHLLSTFILVYWLYLREFHTPHQMTILLTLI